MAPARRFSFDDMLDLKGNTAVYMLYAHARVAGIARKAGRDTAQLAASSSIQLEHPSEVSNPQSCWAGPKPCLAL